jgi:hypothetical protein
MKIFSRTLSLLVIATLGFIYVGCGGSDGDGDPAEKVQLTKLSDTWEISSVTLDNDPRTDFPGLTLTINGAFNSSSPKGPYNFTVGGTRPNPSPWPASGTWSFGSDPKTDIIRLNDDVAIDYQLTDTQLVLSFTYDGDGFAGSRVGEVEGNWVFTFTK